MGQINILKPDEMKIKDIIMYLEGSLPINNFVSFDIIYKNLNSCGIQCSTEELKYALSIMMIERGSIIKNNNLMKSDEYCLMDDYKRRSKYVIAYRKLIDDMPDTSKSFLLISDTHFGSEEEDYELINNLYCYAKKQNVCACFHLGDIFKIDEDNIDKINEQYTKFEMYYPRGIKTYSICGNHDKYMHTVSPINPLFEIPKVKEPLDIRILNRLNSDFNCFASEYFSTTINNQKFHFNHRLYINKIERDKRIDKLEDIDDEFEMFSREEKILISGHLHDGFIYTTNNNLYLGVPSSSYLNKNGVVGYILDVNNTTCNVRVLKSNNKEIFEEENYLINLDNMPTIKKEYKSKVKLLKK